MTSVLNRQRCLGLTMVEILVVTVLIAIVAGTMVMSIDIRSPGKELRELAENFYDRLILAQDESLFSGDLIGVEVFENGYRFLQWYSPPTAAQQLAGQAAAGSNPNNLGQGVVVSNNQANSSANQTAPPSVTGFWEPIQEDAIGASYWLPESYELLLEVDGQSMSLERLRDQEKEEAFLAKLDIADPEENPFKPVLFFLPTADSMAFVIDLYSAEYPELEYRIRSDLLGRMRLIRPGQSDEV